MEHPDLPGWRVCTEQFDYGAKWGVAIDNGAEGPARRRHAVLLPDVGLTVEQAIDRAIPVLKAWASE